MKVQAVKELRLREAVLERTEDQSFLTSLWVTLESCCALVSEISLPILTVHNNRISVQFLSVIVVFGTKDTFWYKVQFGRYRDPFRYTWFSVHGPIWVSLKPDRKTADKTSKINSDGRASCMTATTHDEFC